MNIYSKILIGIISLVFLFSTTGLLFVHHVCDTCEISEILINSEHKHEGDHHVKSCCTESSCHPEEEQKNNDSECCNEDAYYLKITEPFLSYSYTIDLNEKVIQLFDYKLIEFADSKYIDQLFYTSILKPPKLSGRIILRDNCILRI